MSTTSLGALPATNGFEGLKPPRVEFSVISRCMIGACEVSRPPSRPCSQLHSWITLVTWRCDCGTCVHANSGSGGFLSAGPISPDDAAQLAGRISGGADLVFELVIVRFIHHVDAVAFHVEFPAVIDAAQAALLVAAEIQ